MKKSTNISAGNRTQVFCDATASKPGITNFGSVPCNFYADISYVMPTPHE